MAEPCAELVARCFAARTAGHMLHLKTRSYAQHVALNEFYTRIGDGADEFAEAYQGVYDLLEIPLLRPPATSDPVGMITELREWLAEHRSECAGDNTELGNIIDELLHVCDTALYKLRFLK